MRITMISLFFLFLIKINFCWADNTLLDRVEEKSNKKVWQLKELESKTDYFVIYDPVEVANGFCFTKANRIEKNKDTISFNSEDVDLLINNYFAVSNSKKCNDLDFERDYFRVKTLIGTSYLRDLLIYIYDLDRIKNEMATGKIMLSEIDIGYLDTNRDFCYRLSFQKKNGAPYEVIWACPLNGQFEAIFSPLSK